MQTTALRAHLAKPDIESMQDVPDELLNAQQLRVKQTTLRGYTYRDAKALAAYALTCYFLDCKTIEDAVLHWTGIRAFQPVTFQVSLHRIGSRSGLIHTAFLDTIDKKLRPVFAQVLEQACGISSAIFAYNVNFEMGRIADLPKYFANHGKVAKVLLDVYTRLVDLESIV